MLDRRAWILAVLILLAAAAAYVVWYRRPRALVTVRSLTAPSLAARRAPTPSQPATGTLHVEGCNEDFLVKPGELVEPRIVPGASLDRFRALYGNETKPGNLVKPSGLVKPGIWTWDRDPYTLTGEYLGPGNPGNRVEVQVKQGHVVETLDGIELGIDSFGTLFRKMRDKKVEVHERIDGPEGNWVLTVTLYSACGRKFRSEYSRIFPGSPELDKQILPPATDPKAGAAPWRSDAFMNKVITDYALVPSNGSDDDPTAGQPSEHD